MAVGNDIGGPTRGAKRPLAVFGSLSHDPGSRLAGIFLFAFLGVDVVRNSVILIQGDLPASNALSPDRNSPLIVYRDHKFMFCHAHSSPPQARTDCHPCEFQTAPLPECEWPCL